MKLNMKKGKGADQRFYPSKSTIGAYELLQSSTKPIGSKELCATAGLSHSRGAAALTAMFKAGLLVRHKSLNNEFLYQWDPRPKAADLAKEIADAAAEARSRSAGGNAPRTKDRDALIIVLEHLGNALLAAAQSIKTLGDKG